MTTQATPINLSKAIKAAGRQAGGVIRDEAGNWGYYEDADTFHGFQSYASARASRRNMVARVGLTAYLRGQGDPEADDNAEGLILRAIRSQAGYPCDAYTLARLAVTISRAPRRLKRVPLQAAFVFMLVAMFYVLDFGLDARVEAVVLNAEQVLYELPCPTTTTTSHKRT